MSWIKIGIMILKVNNSVIKKVPDTEHEIGAIKGTKLIGNCNSNALYGLQTQALGV